jgi:SAM-dependent methyltransferase
VSESLRELWEAEAENWVYVVRTRWRTTNHHDDFNFPFFLGILPAPQGPTLELGCGEGRIVQALRAGGYDVQGVDASPTMIAAARRSDPDGRYTVADAASLPFPDGSFPLVAAFMSLQDMDDLEGVMREAARVLTPEGRFCFAIIHPLRTAGDFAGPAASSFELRGSYFEQRRFVAADEHEEVRVSMHSEHRPLEVYARALEQAGFVIEALREPRPSEDVVRDDGTGISEKWRRVPFSLHVRAALGRRA